MQSHIKKEISGIIEEIIKIIKTIEKDNLNKNIKLKHITMIKKMKNISRNFTTIISIMKIMITKTRIIMMIEITMRRLNHLKTIRKIIDQIQKRKFISSNLK